MCHWWGNYWNLTVSSVRISVVIHGRPRVLTGMLHGLSQWWYRITKTPDSPQRSLACIQYMPDPLRLPEYCRTRTDKVSWRINQGLSWCFSVVLRLHNNIYILSFWWGRDLADWRPAFRTVRLPSQSTGGHRCDCQLGLLTAYQ